MKAIWKICRKLGLLPKTPFWFGDVQAQAKAKPYTFFAPSRTSLDQIEPGEAIQLWFEYEPRAWHNYSGERMWVVVESRQGNKFTGILDNIPFDIIGLKLGARLEFSAENILSREVADPEGDPTERYWSRCFCSNSILAGLPVFYLSRSKALESKPDQEHPDSGWQFLAEGEFASEIGADGASCVPLGKVLNCDDRWLHLIDAEPGRQFEWNHETDSYEELEPFDPDEDDEQ